MMDDMRLLLDDYTAWLRDKTTLRAIDDQWVAIQTPYLDRHNDYVQIYSRRTDREYCLTDDGATITDLEQSGCKLESKNRRDLLWMTLNGFGVQLAGKALEVRASRENFALRKHNLVQAILAVNDMFYLAPVTVATMFREDVAEWLDLNDVRYTAHVKFAGASGFDHLFHFVIPKSRQQPERILQAVNRPNRDAATSVAFAWHDTRETRKPEATAYALLNDSERPVPAPVLDALRSYGVKPVTWSEREKVREELAA